jgi:predicted secreted hydrolase
MSRAFSKGFTCQVFLLLICILSSLTTSHAQNQGLVVPGRQLQYPQDHGSHPEFPIEWWYVTGHLRDKTHAQGADYQYGFQITFFRAGTKGSQQEAVNDSPKSLWRTRDLIISHIAITDEQGKEYCSQESTSRLSELTKAESATEKLLVRQRGNHLVFDGDRMNASVRCKDKTLKVSLLPEKPLVLHGDNGYVKKGAVEGDASYYVSYTRMAVDAELSGQGEVRRSLVGSAWYDHEIVSSPVARNDVGWDWFALQLSNGNDIMLYQLREPDGTVSPFSRGAVIDRAGNATALSQGECSLAPKVWWKSTDSGVQYPLEWTLSCKKEQGLPSNFELNVAATLKGQEFNGEHSTGKRYWEGRVLVTGNQAGAAVSGQGYMELVGYK